MKNSFLSRRDALKNIVLTTSALTAGSSVITGCSPQETVEQEEVKTPLKSNINHSVCRWCYSSIELEAFAEGAKEIGISSIELTTPEEWKVLQKYGLTSAIGTGSFANIENGFNDPANHEALTKSYLNLIDAAAENGVPNVIVFSGNKRQLTAEQGIENCAVGLDKLVKHAESKKVTLIMELLNSKVNHIDYQCDRTPWGAALIDKVGSPNLKLLYDIYHMQIMEGDIISTIKKYKNYIAHYHTGGVPGRNEINDSQELNYPAIMKAIMSTGYKGYVAQEFIPTYDDKLAALEEGVRICDV